MKLHAALRPLAILGLLSVGAFAVTSAGSTLPGPLSPAVVEGDLEESMEAMDQAFEAVLAAIEKKDADAAMDPIGKMQAGCLQAKTMHPPKLRTVEDKEKAAFLAGYRKEMLVLLKVTADLEIALIDKDFEKAKKLTDEIDGMQKQAHDTYKKMPRGGPGGPGGRGKEKGGS